MDGILYFTSKIAAFNLPTCVSDGSSTSAVKSTTAFALIVKSWSCLKLFHWLSLPSKNNFHTKLHCSSEEAIEHYW